MAFQIRFPEVYERISPPRTDEEIMRELDRRCGYPDSTAVPLVKSIPIDVEPRKGTKWERRSKSEQPPPKKVKQYRPTPPPQNRLVCQHKDGTIGAGPGRERCRACKTERTIGTPWKRYAQRQAIV